MLIRVANWQFPIFFHFLQKVPKSENCEFGTLLSTWQTLSGNKIKCFIWNPYYMLLENSVQPKNIIFFTWLIMILKRAKNSDFLSSEISQLPDRCQVTWNLSFLIFLSSIYHIFSKTNTFFKNWSTLGCTVDGQNLPF